MQVQVLSWAHLKFWMMKFEFRSSHRRIIFARVAELVDAHVSGACSERSAGSSPVPGTRGILQEVQNERNVEFFFYVCLSFGHSLAIFSENPLDSPPRARNRTPTNTLAILITMPPLGWLFQNHPRHLLRMQDSRYAHLPIPSVFHSR